MSMPSKKPYVLSSRDESELNRLKLQHNVWRNETLDFLRSHDALTSGRLLDAGSGPGYTTMDFIREGVEEAWALDSSELFIRFLQGQVEEYEIGNLKVIQSDFSNANLPDSYFDSIFCRWVLMFIADVPQLLESFYRWLKPGGHIYIMEYGPFNKMTLAPENELFLKLYRKVADLIRSYGGNPDIGLDLPALLPEAGFEVESVDSFHKQDSVSSGLWEWMESLSANHANLVEHGLLSSEELNAYYKVVEDYGQNPDAIIKAPVTRLIVAEKPT